MEQTVYVQIPKALYDDLNKFLNVLEVGQVLNEYHFREYASLLVRLGEACNQCQLT